MLNLKVEELLAKQTLKSAIRSKEQVRRWAKASPCFLSGWMAGEAARWCKAASYLKSGPVAWSELVLGCCLGSHPPHRCLP